MNHNCHGDLLLDDGRRMYRCFRDSTLVDVSHNPSECPNCQRKMVPVNTLDQPFIDSEQRMRANTSPLESPRDLARFCDDCLVQHAETCAHGSFLVPTGYVLTVDIAIGGATPFIPRTADIVVPNPSIVRVEGARLKVYERKAGH